jgi:hypothetical protein
MAFNLSKQRLYSILLALGAGILLFRTLRMMLVENAFDILATWVSGLLVLEFLVDLGCMIGSILWFIANNRAKAGLPLKLGAIATILHAIRVLIFIMGRLDPWKDFDIKAEHVNAVEFDPFWLYFAGILSIAGIIGMILIWWLIRKRRNIIH